MKKVTSFVLLISTIASNSAFAQEAIEETPADEYTNTSFVAPLAKDRRAPYTGLLLTPRAAAEVMTRIETFDKVKALEIKKAVEDLAAHHEFEIKELTTTFKSEKDTLLARNTSLEGQLKSCETANIPKPEDPPSRLTWFGAGLIGGILATSVTFFTVQSLSK